MDPRLAIGFVNYTIDFSKVNLANRPGKVDLEGEFADNGGSIQGLNTLNDINSFHKICDKTSTALQKQQLQNFLVNGGINLSDDKDVL
jgi:iron complex outermembrane receptor protein